MAHKRVLFQFAAREKILRGATQLADLHQPPSPCTNSWIRRTTASTAESGVEAPAVTPTRFHNWVRRLAFSGNGKDNCPTRYRANTAGALARALRGAGLELEGDVRFAAGAYHYWRFSKPLFYAAALASRIATHTPLCRFKSILVVRCVKLHA